MISSDRFELLSENAKNAFDRVALVRIDDRSYSKEIYITDAQYACRDFDWRENSVAYDREKPFFFSLIPSEEYIGISPTADRTQYNFGFDLSTLEECEDDAIDREFGYHDDEKWYYSDFFYEWRKLFKRRKNFSQIIE